MHNKKRIMTGIILIISLSVGFIGCGMAAEETISNNSSNIDFEAESADGWSDVESNHMFETDKGNESNGEETVESIQENTGQIEVQGESEQKETLPESAQEMTTEEENSTVERSITYLDKDGNQGSFLTDVNGLLHSYDWDNLKQKDGYLWYDSPQVTSALGIDVSEYQGEINWQLVKESGVTFVIIRLGYRGYGEQGSLVLDKNYHTNMQGALEAGLNIGVYFFSQAINEEEAREEAQFVLQNLAGYRIDYPVMFDPEKIQGVSARANQVSGEAFTRHAVAFCDTIKMNGYETGIYTDILWQAEELDMGRLKEYTIWYSDYQETPQTPYQFTYWQYSETGRVNGIQGSVDLNLHFMIP